MEISRSIEAIVKDMEDLFENINNLNSYEYLMKSNELKQEFERHKLKLINNNQINYYYENMIMF